MRLFRILLLVAGLWAAPATAEPAPVVAPAGAWVEQVRIPEPNPAEADKPVQALLVTSQSFYGDEVEHFVELATLIQNGQGLAGMGTITLPWQPDRGELIVHKVHIVRDGKAIDLLANGQSFTVLRRENNLESAMLDGVLTAVIQPEGLAVGDVLNIAFTLRQKKGAIPLRGENFFFLSPDIAVRNLHFRQVWSASVPMRWRATDAMGKPRVTKSRWGNELLLDLRDVRGPKVPELAPVRYAFPALLELSEYRDWSEISRLLAPLYQSARAMGTDSPLRAEAARIAAATADPEKRALAALRLVQDKIRYLALSMGEGGLTPASADQTWSRKFGDCKGKTATLLALLDVLGIEAEPVVVNRAYGAALRDHLPRVGLFDHVIVRARINGRSLWLDGTSSGERSLEDVSSYPGGFGLPIRAGGAELETLPLTPPSKPLSDLTVTYDASAGFEQLVPVSGTVIFRGDLATKWRVFLALQGEKDVRDALKHEVPDVPNEDFEIGSIDADEESNVFTFTFAGKTRLGWTRAPSSSAIRVKFNNDVIEWTPDFKREDGLGKDLPFALLFPSYSMSRETIILPARGAGFTVEAENFDREVAGTRIARTVTLEGGKAVAVSTFRRLRSEIGAAEAAAAATELAKINAATAYVRSPENYRPGEAEVQAILTEEPKKAADFVSRGYYFLQQGKVAEAVADFDRAAALAPDWSRPLSNRAVAMLHRGRLAEAETSLARAAQLNDEDFVVHQGYGLLRLAQDKPADAVEALSRSLALEPDNAFTLGVRAEAYQRAGRNAEALADVDRAIQLNPQGANLLALKARLLSVSGDESLALATADKLIAMDDQAMFGLVLKAETLQRFGRVSEAAGAYAAALAKLDRLIAEADGDSARRSMARQRIELLVNAGRAGEAIRQADTLLRSRPDSVPDLNTRCWARVLANIELDLALKDCDLALRNDPENAMVADSRAYVKLRLGRLDEAIADFDTALGWSPHQAASLYGRGLAKLKKGDREGGERDLAAARRREFDIETRFKRYGLAP